MQHMHNGEYEKKRQKKPVFEVIMTENFPPSQCQTDTKVQILEVSGNTGRINVQEMTPGQIIILKTADNQGQGTLNTPDLLCKKCYKRHSSERRK